MYFTHDRELVTEVTRRSTKHTSHNSEPEFSASCGRTFIVETGWMSIESHLMSETENRRFEWKDCADTGQGKWFVMNIMGLGALPRRVSKSNY